MEDRKIQNFDALAVTDARRALLTIAEAGLQAVDTKRVMRELARLEGNSFFYGGETLDLSVTQKIVLIAIGKCAADAAMVMEELLGDRITRGVIADVKICPESKRLKTFCGTHPLPSANNREASVAIVEALSGLTEHDAALFVISGGGSTLLFLPEDEKNNREIDIFNALTAAGAKIGELNIVRRHLSLARGGNLAKYAHPARVISLIMSDVPGDDLSTVASGPTVKDVTTVLDAITILKKYGADRVCPIENCGFIETPKEDKFFSRVSNILAVSNKKALEAMAASAERLGFHATIRETNLIGEARAVGQMVAEELHAAGAKSVLLWGGETTVTVRGKGDGGRNREVAASAMKDVREGEEILSLASDGRDHGAQAGAICDTMTKKAAEEAGLNAEDFLKENNVGQFFEKAGGLVMTGDTGSNVSDLIIALKN